MTDEIKNEDCLETLKELEDGSVDLLVTDPPYGISFMGKAWDKALPSVEVWRECLRVLKDGAFAFVMSIPRADCLARMVVGLEDAGFKVGFSPVYWAMASGFPKAQNCAKVILKKFLQVSLQGVSRFPYKDEGSQSDSRCRFCGGLLRNGQVIFRDASPLLNDALKYNRLSSPSVEIQVDNEHKYMASYALLSFHHATQDLKPLASWQTIVSSVLESKPDDWLPQFSTDNWGLVDKFPLLHGYGQCDSTSESNNGVCENGIGVQSKLGKSEMVDGNTHKSIQSYLYYTTYCPACQEQMSNGYAKLVGSYSGWQPKPAVEIIIVAMKPLSEKTYVDQALKNKKGITWLENGRIPYESEEVDFTRVQDGRIYGDGICIGKGEQKETTPLFKQSGRFPANLLVSDDVLNDGQNHKAGIAVERHGGGGQIFGSKRTMPPRPDFGFGDSGSFSRYFDLDKWWAERIKELPASVQKTFPFLIVPKASKSEKNKGCEGLVEQEYSQQVGATSYTKSTGKTHLRDTARKNNHPTVKPLKLMSYLITLGSREGDIVLDPFMGSGTTALACLALGRHFIGSEINKDYYDIAIKRIENARRLI